MGLSKVVTTSGPRRRPSSKAGRTGGGSGIPLPPPTLDDVEGREACRAAPIVDDDVTPTIQEDRCAP
ncbi:hypothetical protein PACID_01790 [Acidipropionibacterium acidipropionici ATCC 4875]|uniref:Uncharacterized protein n=1 Tax=Acidipropionibacterium acidipropionici (strain ATCC 4875 / DSM 20272 / JCM 6432 / NBRC 12425 / NCIMB 8070 / 4) TaxID=1171373 RepID=K7SFG6_ACIA4|nr:hypothetical protein PACID_01790 [Acidipropionibacterium acidipropionici ATCC 4875]